MLGAGGGAARSRRPPRGSRCGRSSRRAVRWPERRPACGSCFKDGAWMAGTCRSNSGARAASSGKNACASPAAARWWRRCLPLKPEKPGTYPYEIRVADPAADASAKSQPFVIAVRQEGRERAAALQHHRLRRKIPAPRSHHRPQRAPRQLRPLAGRPLGQLRRWRRHGQGHARSQRRRAVLPRGGGAGGREPGRAQPRPVAGARRLRGQGRRTDCVRRAEFVRHRRRRRPCSAGCCRCRCPRRIATAASA